MTARRPFFSILIPTKNRSDLITRAIDSVFIQSFKDYELIIIDNNLDEETEYLIKNKYKKGYMYYRTGGLNMPDNWEYAFTKSTGKYITILTDRMFYASNNVLEWIHKAIIQYNYEVISWRWAIYNEKNEEVKGFKNNFIIKELNSSDILNGFFEGGKDRHWFNVTSPKALNSCVSRGTYDKIINRFGRFFYPITPDFTSSFILLWHESKILHLQDGLVVSGGHSVSNGLNAVKNKNGFLQYIKELGSQIECTYKYTPIPVVSVFNCMYNDLFYISNKVGWGLSWDMINKVEYFTLIHDEIRNNVHLSDKESDLITWNDALSKESVAMRIKVTQRIKQINKTMFHMLMIRKIKNIYNKVGQIYRH